MQHQNILLLKKGKNSLKNIFFVHAGNGEILNYLEICSHIHPDYNCWGIREISVDMNPMNRTIEDCAEDYMQQILTIQNQGPFVMIGWCYGGNRVVEMCYLLEKLGNVDNKVFLINSNGPNIASHMSENFIADYIAIDSDDEVGSGFSLETEKKLLNRLNILDDQSPQSFDYFWNEIFENVSTSKEDQKIIFEAISKTLPADRKRAIPYFPKLSLKRLLHYYAVLRSDSRMQYLYHPRYLENSQLTYIEAIDEKMPNSEKWIEYSNTSQYKQIKCNHFNIFESPYVQELARIINEQLL